MTDTLATYDELPYESHPFAETHPDNLAVVAILFGLTPAPVERCRVLELGCAGGGNLFPMAEALPDSTFVGIDLSRRQIIDGQQIVAALGLKNLDLRHASIMDVDAAYGRFDYILCHGVFSWVPEPVQDKILSICRENLAPHGIAHISYNIYPGWHVRGILRDLLGYHDRPAEAPRERVRRTRALLDTLARCVPHLDGAYGRLLREELDLLRRQADSYLLHEHLEEVNRPLAFHQFVEWATARGLRYLGEAQLFGMATSNLGPAIEQKLRELSSDVIHLEQYMDYLRNRPFRETLLCQREVEPDWTLRPERIYRLHVASPLRPVAREPDARSLEAEAFATPAGLTVNTWDPQLKAALLELHAQWPRPIAFDLLLKRASTRLGRGTDETADAGEARALAAHLLRCFTANLVELHCCPPSFVRKVSGRPLVSAWARMQAERGEMVTNRRHELVPLDPLSRQVIRLLDGTRDRTMLLGTLADASVEQLDRTLHELASAALLVE